MGGRPVDAGRDATRPARRDLPPFPPVRRADGSVPEPPPHRAGPPRGGRGAAARPGRVRRFVRRHGWRAYAVPLLAVATTGVLVDLARDSPGGPPADAVEAADRVARTTGAPSGSPAEEEATAPPVDPPAEGTGDAAAATAEGDAGPPAGSLPAAGEGYVEQGAGSLSVVDGGSTVHGSGPLRRFVVEVEDGIGVDGAVFAQAVEATLGDPRSWGAGGRLSFQRVGAADAAAGGYDFRVSLVSPGSMETYCPGVGTGGYTSCRYGERAVINLARWATAVPHYGGDVATYRQYVVNHEVGHAIGNREHPPCPGPGQLAPVMQQQTLGLDGCLPNAWPYP